MLEKYFVYFYTMMKYSKLSQHRRRKKAIQLYYMGDTVVVALNDYKNRRVLFWFYYKPTNKIIVRLAIHGYHARPLRKLIEKTITKINNDKHFREVGILQRRSYSWKKDAAFRRNYFGSKSFRDIIDAKREQRPQILPST